MGWECQSHLSTKLSNLVLCASRTNKNTLLTFLEPEHPNNEKGSIKQNYESLKNIIESYLSCRYKRILRSISGKQSSNSSFILIIMVTELCNLLV